MELDSLLEFILSISASDTSAIPRMFALWTVTVSWLKFASRTCVLSDLLSARSACYVAARDLQTPDPTRVSARAGRTPCMGIKDGYTQTSDVVALSFPILTWLSPLAGIWVPW